MPVMIKSKLNGPKPFRAGKRRVSKRNSGSSPIKSPHNRRQGVAKKRMRNDDSHQMHARISPKHTTSVIRSRHPDAVPTINFLHMN